MRSLIFICSVFMMAYFFISCKKQVGPVSDNNLRKYSVVGTQILNDSIVFSPRGVNAMHVYSPGGKDMNSWNINYIREFIGDVKDVPISGSAIPDPNSGAYLHPLQKIVDSNRVHQRVTILCAFGWNGTSAQLFTGKSPATTAWWSDFKLKLHDWAVQFKNQPDVWLEVWNEPYSYNRSDGYTDSTWTANMNELVSVVRNAGNNNIVVVPCAEAGQDESVLNNVGQSFLTGKTNILFDVHAYEKWLLVSPAAMGARLQQLKQNNLPVFFGETAPMNAQVLMNPATFLDSAYSKNIGAFAWVWKKSSTEKDALLDNTGMPNNNNNNNWGTLFKGYLARP
jgi:mannan endo-1,4-beta-mannosidase